MKKLTAATHEPTEPTQAEITATIKSVQRMSRTEDQLQAAQDLLDDPTFYYACNWFQVRALESLVDCCRALERGDERVLENVFGIYR